MPVFLSSGAATSRSLGLGGGSSAASGIRLVSLDRPGLGASTPAPGRNFADFAADVAEFASLRGLGRPAMVGHSQGAPFALACAAHGGVSSVALVSAADEVAAPEFAEALPSGLRQLVDTAVADPAEAERLFSAFTPERMWDMVMANSPESDLAVYGEPEFAAAYRRALAEGFVQGPGGYARDTVLAMGRWDFDLAAVDVPVQVWYGAQDSTHSPDLGATLTARIPGAVRHVVPEAGGALLWTHAERILAALPASSR